MRKKKLYAAICIAFAISSLLIMISNNSNNKYSKTELYELEFYKNLLESMSTKSIVPVEELIPVKWDRMKVFPAYYTKEDKINYVGFRYAQDLEDISHEDVISIVFIWDGSLAYYVDYCIPRMFNIKENADDQYMLQIGKNCQVPISKGILKYHNDDWAFYNYIDEADITDNPYFEFKKADSGHYALSLKMDS